jgi:hypothetical protein
VAAMGYLHILTCSVPTDQSKSCVIAPLTKLKKVATRPQESERPIFIRISGMSPLKKSTPVGRSSYNPPKFRACEERLPGLTITSGRLMYALEHGPRKDPNSFVNFFAVGERCYGTGNRPGFLPRLGPIRPNFLSALSKAC